MRVTQIEQTICQHALARVVLFAPLKKEIKKSCNAFSTYAPKYTDRHTEILRKNNPQFGDAFYKFGRPSKLQNFEGNLAKFDKISEQEEDAEYQIEMQHSRENQRDTHAIRAQRRAPELSNSSTWQTDSTNTHFTLEPQCQPPRN